MGNFNAVNVRQEDRIWKQNNGAIKYVLSFENSFTKRRGVAVKEP
jgi:hypothetical protein